jgi:hypothetical protein
LHSRLQGAEDCVAAKNRQGFCANPCMRQSAGEVGINGVCSANGRFSVPRKCGFHLGLSRKVAAISTAGMLVCLAKARLFITRTIERPGGVLLTTRDGNSHWIPCVTERV